MSRNKGKAILPVSLALLLVMTGCSSQQEAVKLSNASAGTTAASTYTPVPTETVETTGPDIGTESDSDLCQKIYVTNKTGKNITGFAIREDSSASYGENMMQDSDVFKNDENRKVYYEEDASTAGVSSTADSSLAGALVNVAYDLQLTYEDGTTEEIMNFPIGNAEEVVLNIATADEGGFVYLTYTDINGSSVSTLDSEKADYDAAVQAAASAAAAQQAAEEAAAQQAAEEAAAQQAAEEAAAQQAAEEAAAAQAAAEAAAAQQAQSDSSTSSNADSGCLSGGVLTN